MKLLLPRQLVTLGLLAAAILTIACAADDDGDPSPPTGATVWFDLDGDLAGEAFWDFPFPSDLRLTDDGRADYAGFPNRRHTAIMTGLLELAVERRAFPTTATTYFRFDAPLAPRLRADVIAAVPDAPILLVDVDPASPERGRLLPTVAQTLVVDDFAPEHLLAVAARPGMILAGGRTYAVVVRRDADDADGAPLGVAPGLAALAAGEIPVGARGAAAAALYTPLWDTLDTLGIDRTEVAAATVFTTADVVADLSALSDAVLAAHDVTIEGLAVDADDGDHERYCELLATVTYPQFQVGNPPFDDDGQFAYGDDGALLLQRTETAPVTITLPKGEMPAGGYPLFVFFHGSGGLSSGLADLGKTTVVGGEPTKGEGPGYVVAAHGLAAASSALPVNPERLSGASDFEYLNINNLRSMPFTFQQGVLESRLFIEALASLQIAPESLAGCNGLSLPAGETSYHFDGDRFVGGGQSMGGMYTNMVGAVEPRLRALVPTGAGGMWHLMILETEIIPGASGLVGAVFNTPFDSFTFLHPGLSVLAAAWEVAEPMVSMPRLAHRPLPGHPARSIYQPVGKDDVFFPTSVYDAAALAYANQEAGDAVWPEMQDVLALDGLDGLAPYDVAGNRVSEDGTPYTGVVVQYEGDGIDDPHYLYRQSDAVKHQYGCFLESFVATGEAVVPAPAPLGTACP